MQCNNLHLHSTGNPRLMKVHNKISLQQRFPFTTICSFNEQQTRFNKILSR
ncbi:hypothetical protein E2C01_010474 [Portunus trituberculatus]|uniref:Uncharacterized protein n=1 Tax=Portunus trituberculatus TaxID=210409 RepID=A0A5B7D8S4_PORTR|nr:hypothetical protein [Portunus trituberculatus]